VETETTVEEDEAETETTVEEDGAETEVVAEDEEEDATSVDSEVVEVEAAMTACLETDGHEMIWKTNPTLCQPMLVAVVVDKEDAAGEEMPAEVDVVTMDPSTNNQDTTTTKTMVATMRGTTMTATEEEEEEAAMIMDMMMDMAVATTIILPIVVVIVVEDSYGVVEAVGEAEVEAVEAVVTRMNMPPQKEEKRLLLVRMKAKQLMEKPVVTRLLPRAIHLLWYRRRTAVAEGMHLAAVVEEGAVVAASLAERTLSI
jgi:hypothetical protein